MNSETIKAELSKFQIKFRQNGINAMHQHLQANTTTKQTSIALNHPYLMKIAHTKRKSQKNSNTSNHNSSTTKETYRIKSPVLVPFFAAR